MMRDFFIGIDIGGSWIKGVAVTELLFSNISNTEENGSGQSFGWDIKKVASPLNAQATEAALVGSIQNLITQLGADVKNVSGIGISTTGIVNYHGSQIELASSNHQVLTQKTWVKSLETVYNCPVSLVNDADAACIGVAERGYLKGDHTIGLMVIGTGLGFTLWRNGRRWRQGGQLPLLGSVRMPVGEYNDIASASALARKDKDNNLNHIFRDDAHKTVRNEYLRDIARIMGTACILYQLDEVYVASAGIVQAADAQGFDLEAGIREQMGDFSELKKDIKIKIIHEGNLLQLIGACSLAIGESVAQKEKLIPAYNAIKTEIPYDEKLMLHQESVQTLVQTMWKAEQEAGMAMEKNLAAFAGIAEKIALSIEKGGRLIYVGAGASGRIAAMDAIEIPVTYGLPKDKMITIISGGVADACMDVESDFEEDASSLPEMLLLNISSADIVIGISASGSSYFVQSALSFAKYRGAYSALIRNEPAASPLPFCHEVIPLDSGFEVVAGSTRMKAGTATKKILNFISSAAMIRLGKVYGSYMIDVACVNQKLVNRAKKILFKLYGIDETEALRMLTAHHFDLRKTIVDIESSASLANKKK